MAGQKHGSRQQVLIWRSALASVACASMNRFVILAWALPAIPVGGCCRGHYPETRASPGGYLHRTWSFGVRPGRHAHGPGSGSASCCCNGGVGLNWQTTCIWHVTWKCGRLIKLYFYSGGGFKKKTVCARGNLRTAAQTCSDVSCSCFVDVYDWFSNDVIHNNE